MFNPLDKKNRKLANKQTRAASRRSVGRRLTFEHVESRTMLSGTTTEVEATPVTIPVASLTGEVQTLSNIHLHEGVQISFRSSSFQPSSGGFLSTNFAQRNSVEMFSSSSSLSFLDSTDSFLSILPTGQSGITLDLSPFGDVAGSSNYNVTLNTVMSPIAIVGPDLNADLKLPSGPNVPNQNSRAGDQGGAIRIEPILQPIATNSRGYIILPPAQKSELAFDSMHSMSPALSIAPANPIAGELARAVVFEMAGGEPLLRNPIDRDAKLHSSTEKPTDAASNADLLTAVETTGTRPTKSTEGFASTSAGGTAIPTTAAVAAAMNAFMLDWNWMDFAFPLSLPQAVDRPAVEANSDAGGATLSAQDQAMVRLPEENQRLAALDFAPVLVALALERSFPRTLDGSREGRPKRPFVSRK